MMYLGKMIANRKNLLRLTLIRSCSDVLIRYDLIVI